VSSNGAIGGRTRPCAAIRARLRSEVNFGCPICRSPFLAYHHFDPPWEPRHIHHEPGMIALCAEHHSFADGGNYPIQYLRGLKENPPQTPPNGKLPWNAPKIFISFGGNYFVTAKGKAFSLRVDGKEVFSLKESDVGYLAINASIWNASGELVFRIDANDILPVTEELGDLECSTRGKEIAITSQGNNASLKLRYDRQTEDELIAGVIAKWPKSFSSALKTHKTANVRGFIHSALDDEGLCPVIKLRADIYAATVPVRTLGRGITADFRGLGYDKPTLTGLDAGEGGFGIVYGDTRQEKFHMGSE